MIYGLHSMGCAERSSGLGGLGRGGVGRRGPAGRPAGPSGLKSEEKFFLNKN
jgi:hypothetical protein